MKEMLLNDFSIQIEKVRLTYYVKKYGLYKNHPISQKYGILVEKSNVTEIIEYIRNNVTDKKLVKLIFLIFLKIILYVI